MADSKLTTSCAYKAFKAAILMMFFNLLIAQNLGVVSAISINSENIASQLVDPSSNAFI